MSITVPADAFLIDCPGKEPAAGAAGVVEGERIKLHPIMKGGTAFTRTL